MLDASGSKSHNSKTNPKHSAEHCGSEHHEQGRAGPGELTVDTVPIPRPDCAISQFILKLFLKLF